MPFVDLPQPVLDPHEYQHLNEMFYGAEPHEYLASRAELLALVAGRSLR